MDYKKLFLEENVGGWDLLIRALAGSLAIVALALGYGTETERWILALIAFAGLYTGITRHCTPYVLFGISTKR